MTLTGALNEHTARFRRLDLGARLTLSIGGSIILISVALFTWLYHLQEKQAMQQVETQADALLTEMMIVRDWVAEYGDVWTTEPGELFVEGRDGFYRKSPGMVTKEISVLSNSQENFRFHITSTQLKNPENVPDSFELAALHRFEEKPTAVSQIEVVDGERFYRRMIPLITQASCLECHQGYQIGDIRGGISILVPMAEVDQALAEGRLALAGTAVLITGLMMGLLYWLVRRMVVRPLHHLQNAALAMGEGNYQAHCTLRTGDELEALGQAFNQMAGNLKSYQDSLHYQIEQRTRELNALAEMSLTISRSHDLKTVLNEALAQALQATTMEGGAIHLLRSSGELSIIIHQGLPSAVVACLTATSSAAGCSIWGLQQGVRVIDLQAKWETAHCFQPHCPALTEGYRGLLVAPLHSGNRTLGTLTLLQKQPLEMSAEQMQFVTCLGNQLGVAVENARFHKEIERLAILEERGRIARELHDSLAQTLSWLHLKMDMLTQSLETGNLPQTRQDAYHVQQVVGQACFEVRESIDGLRLHPADGLSRAITTYVDEFSRRSRLPVHLAIGEECRLSPVVEIEALRILQEALTNAYKHSEASYVDVRLQCEGEYVALSVRDDGRGFVDHALSDGGHFGLRIMQERAERVGGTFQLHTTPGTGVQVVVYLPVEEGTAVAPSSLAASPHVTV
jgi:two-component system, NarL family, nitrate/nitrite sensor histidine kinase NarX